MHSSFTAGSRAGTSRALVLRARRRRAGFTLIEMMVALTIGALVIATVYTVGASAARHFQEQQRVSQVQLSVRLALDRIRRDVARAAFHGTMNSAGDAACGPPPLAQIRGVVVDDRYAYSTAVLGTDNGTHGDQLSITGNFRTGEAFIVREWASNQLQLSTNYMGYRRSFSADPATTNIDVGLVNQTFPPNMALMVRIGGGMRIWTQVASVAATTTGTSATITTSNARPSCPAAIGMEGWAQGGVTVAPVSLVRYEIVDATTLPALGLAPRNAAVVGPNGILVRTEVNPLTGAVLDGPVPVLEYAVHFDVDVFADVGLATAPSQIQVFDDVNAETRTAPATAGTIRGVRISLAARTPEQDPRLTETMPPMADGTPRVFRPFNRPGGGAARVRSAYTEVFLPNSALN